jgi:hypothetical protein
MCGARCRTKGGAPCAQPAMIGSNRCRMHFGHSSKFQKHGRYSLAAEEERRQNRALLKEMKALNKQLEDDRDGK